MSTPAELRLMRHRAGYTVDGLARRLGLARSTVAAVESGQQEPSSELVTAWQLSCAVPGGGAGDLPL